MLWENKWLFMGFLIKMTVKIFYLFNVKLANIKSRILVRNFNSALLFLYPAAMFLFKISNLKRARAEFFTQIRIDKKGEKMPWKYGELELPWDCFLNNQGKVCRTQRLKKSGKKWGETNIVKYKNFWPPFPKNIFLRKLLAHFFMKAFCLTKIKKPPNCGGFLFTWSSVSKASFRQILFNLG